MKKVSGFLVVIAIAAACNNQAKDSVDTADSINKANLDSPGSTQPVATDEATASFMVKAADGGMTEVQLAEMAQQKATNQRVKDFAAMMVHDHTAVNDQVKTMAAQRNVVLPTAVSDDHQKAISDLNSKTGKDFDKAFMDQMVKDHETTIDLFEDAANDVNDSEMKTLINNTLPKLKSHLDSAKEIQKALK